jgi:hypothetical protein
MKLKSILLYADPNKQYTNVYWQVRNQIRNYIDSCIDEIDNAFILQSKQTVYFRAYNKLRIRLMSRVGSQVRNQINETNEH